MLPHIVHDSQVLGGGLLVSDRLEPILEPDAFADARLRGRPRASSELRASRGRAGRKRYVADSAEAVRALKRSLGVACRPTTVPVDVWARKK